MGAAAFDEYNLVGGIDPIFGCKSARGLFPYIRDSGDR
jgi:hypothetical protein